MRNRVSDFLEKFRRITSEESYIPELDGLRFIAIFWVVIWMHLTNFVNVKFYEHKLFSSYIIKVILEGKHGVSFFFMISGFILGLPFARQHLLGAKKVSLKNYYVRRLTRLEPPYLAALSIAFIGLIFIKGNSFIELLPHFGASAIYCHKLIYNTNSTILGVAWSLEIDVQFYLLAPFLAFLYKIRRRAVRYLVFGILIFFSTAIGFTGLYKRLPDIVPFLGCFLIGMIICDMYINKIFLRGRASVWYFSGITIFALLPFLPSLDKFFPYLLKLILMGLFFYIGITVDKMKKLLKIQWITIIGGMCYSIYLLQFIIMHASFPVLSKLKFGNQWIGFLTYSGALAVLILCGSMIFYRFIEQPCMHKDWYKFKRKDVPEKEISEKFN